ncbi:tRNA(Ile)-lysidine synthase [Candidatus Hartigia pinicola]|nr:tRNA(Ile)-lysidine synthase [Candidatus Hartigia pinicola]
MIIQSQVIIKHVLNKINNFKKILVGFSGGIDSTVLLHVLCHIKNYYRPFMKIRAIHIHHGLNVKASAWEAHCKILCQQWNIPLVCHYITVDSSNNGIESSAREARYQSYRNELHDDEIILTAQHLDDQAETFILALKRGSGPAGLSSMPELLRFNTTDRQSWLLRPLLEIVRSNLEIYANENKLSWIEDDSNKDVRYDRNFLRLHVIPILSKRWPYFSVAVSRSALLCADQESLLDELLADALHNIIGDQGELFINGLLDCSSAKRNALLRRWIALHQVSMPSLNTLKRIWQEVALARQDAQPICQLGHVDIRRSQGKLWIVRRIKNLLGQKIQWEYPKPLILPEELGLLKVMQGEGNIRPPLPTEKVTVLFGVQGALKIVGRRHSRNSKKIWQELGVSPWMRRRIPLIYYNNQLITAVGYFITSEGKVVNNTSGVAYYWL